MGEGSDLGAKLEDAPNKGVEEFKKGFKSKSENLLSKATPESSMKFGYDKKCPLRE